MKPHLTLSIMSRQAHEQGDAAKAIAATAVTVRPDEVEREPIESAHSGSQRAIATAHVWRHKLVLIGELDNRSAPELDEEIECLCEEGVTTLTLDLGQLETIDAAGVTAIARRGAFCKMRGLDFAVSSGSRSVRSALAEAGASDLLVAEPDAGVVRFPDRYSDESAAYRSTAMIKSLQGEGMTA